MKENEADGNDRTCLRSMHRSCSPDRVLRFVRAYELRLRIDRESVRLRSPYRMLQGSNESDGVESKDPSPRQERINFLTTRLHANERTYLGMKTTELRSRSNPVGKRFFRR